jgi:hypothetical protein
MTERHSSTGRRSSVKGVQLASGGSASITGAASLSNMNHERADYVWRGAPRAKWAVQALEEAERQHGRPPSLPRHFQQEAQDRKASADGPACSWCQGPVSGRPEDVPALYCSDDCQQAVRDERAAVRAAQARAAASGDPAPYGFCDICGAALPRAVRGGPLLRCQGECSRIHEKARHTTARRAAQAARAAAAGAPPLVTPQGCLCVWTYKSLPGPGAPPGWVRSGYRAGDGGSCPVHPARTAPPARPPGTPCALDGCGNPLPPDATSGRRRIYCSRTCACRAAVLARAARLREAGPPARRRPVVLIVTAPQEVSLTMVSPPGNHDVRLLVHDDDQRCDRCGYKIARCSCRQGPKIKRA